jgi:hypothetical protein
MFVETSCLPAEKLLRAEVAETIKCAQLDHIDWSVAPEPKTDLAWAIGSLGKLIYQLATNSKVSSAVRAELLGQLIDAGMAPDARFGGKQVNGIEIGVDGRGRSSLLMLCVLHGFASGADLLLRRGADALASKGDHGFTIVDQAVTNADAACLRLALNAAPYAAYMSSPSGVTFPANLFGSVTASWVTPAAARELMEVLLEHGLPRDGLLSKMTGAGRDCSWIVDILVDCGCDPTENGNAPAIGAARAGKVLMLGRLLERGVDANLRGEGGATLMRYGARYPAIKTLLRAWRSSTVVADAAGTGGESQRKRNLETGPL